MKIIVILISLILKGLNCFAVDNTTTNNATSLLKPVVVSFKICEVSTTSTVGFVTMSFEGEKIYVSSKPIIVNSDITKAEVEFGFKIPSYVVLLKCNNEGRGKLLQATKRSLGKRMAFIVDNKIVSIVAVHVPIPSGEISVFVGDWDPVKILMFVNRLNWGGNRIDYERELKRMHEEIDRVTTKTNTSNINLILE